MLSLKTLYLATSAALLFPAISASAIPTSPSNDVKVFLRDADFAYRRSEELEAAIHAHNALHPLKKRSHATVESCQTASCTDCTTVWDSDFVANSACIPAKGTNCLIVSNLDDANIWYWAHDDCDGNNTDLKGCPQGKNAAGAPGTNSIGVHVGCSE
ncbi:hypothetical protein F5Y10DRAFT_294246 [Nemania abortiva]|nr:hypothetical protein F5Y10DRAFT_294246 [Nemania abortiva]